MANTTNFNWETPDDTDLVKDGALAIRTLGNSIDTSFVDLKGGTTGQILSKASNTDLDYTWITNDVGDITNVAVTAPITGGGSSGSVTIGIDDGTTTQKGAVQLEDSTSSTSTTKAATPNSVKSAYDLANAAIPKSLVDAAGDLVYATANDTVARLAIGTANQVLRVNSGATAPEWATVSSGSLTLISATTFSAASSHSVNSCFSSTYKYYLVLTDFTASTSNTSLNFRLRASSTDTTTNYDAVIGVFYGGTAAAETNANGTDEVKFSSNKTSADVITARIEFYNPNAASQTSFTTHSAGGYGTDRFTWVGGGLQNSTTQFDGFSIYPAAGTITGSVKVYGYAN